MSDQQAGAMTTGFIIGFLLCATIWGFLAGATAASNHAACRNAHGMVSDAYHQCMGAHQ